MAAGRRMSEGEVNASDVQGRRRPRTTNSRLRVPGHLADALPQFTGREWVFRRLADWIATSSSSFLLVGEPGTGKSLVAAQLVRLSEEARSDGGNSVLGEDSLAVAHFCRAFDTAALDPLRLVESLAEHFADCVGDAYVRALTKAAGRETTVEGTALVELAEAGAHVTGVRISVGQASPVVAFERFVREPLVSSTSPATLNPSVVLVDALDESLTWPSDETVVTLVRAILEANLPLRFVLTSRRDARIERELGKHDLDLGNDAPAEVDDVREYAASRLAALPEATRLSVAGKVTGAAGGNFLYARYVLDDLGENPELDPATLDLPEGLSGHYRTFIRRELTRSRERWEDRYRPLLGTVAVARGRGLTARQLAGSARLPLSATNDGLLVLSQYLVGPPPDGPFRLYHHSFRDFLFCDADYRVYPAEANEAVASFLRSGAQWAAADDYTIENLPMHAVEALRADPTGPQRARLRGALSDLLGDFAFLEEKTSRFGIAELLADIRAAVDTAPGEETLEAILRVLDREAHDLADWNREELPQFLAQQAFARAEVLAEQRIADAARERLEDLRSPYLVLRWRSGEESSAALRTLRNRDVDFLAVTIASDEVTVASGSRDGSIILWNLNSGTRLSTLSAHGAAVRAVAFSDDGRWLLSGSEDGTVKLWNAESGAETMCLKGHGAAVAAVCFVDASGSRVLSGSGDKCLMLWDARTGAVERVLEGHEYAVTSVAASPDGRYAFSGSWDHTVRMWDLHTGREGALLHTHGDGVLAVCVSRDGRFAISGAYDGGLRFHSLETPGLPAAEAKSDELVWSIAPIHGGRVVAALDDGTLELWQIEPPARVGILSGHGLPVRGVATTRDGRRAVSASEDETLMVWDLTAAADDSVRRGHGVEVDRAAMSPDGARAASCSNDGLLRAWQVVGGKPLWEHRFEQHRPDALAVSRDGSRLSLTRSAGVVDHLLHETWSFDSGERLETIDGDFGSTVSLDESRLVTCTWDLKLRVIDLSRWEPIRSWDLKPAEWPKSVAIAPDGRLVVAAFDSGARACWDVTTGEARLARTRAGWIWKIAIADDGARAVIGRDEGLEVWNLATGAFQMRPQPADVVDLAMVGCLHVVTANQNGTVAFWGLEPFERLAVVPVEIALSCLACSPDGDAILVGDEWGNVHLLGLVAPGVNLT